jgi:hypothetical protein
LKTCGHFSGQGPEGQNNPTRKARRAGEELKAEMAMDGISAV